tara:strand:+ start:1048 stop:1227 length:180 start_codon:yes stop_codon:yes gene_type:complete
LCRIYARNKIKIPKEYVNQKLSPSVFAKKNGIKNVTDNGIAIKIFLENVIVFSKSLYSK